MIKIFKLKSKWIAFIFLVLVLAACGQTPTPNLSMAGTFAAQTLAAMPEEATTEAPKAQPTPTATPTRAESPVATPTPESQELSIRPLTTPTPPATPPARFVPMSLLVYYDANDDGQPGAGEGITGISAQAYEVATNELLAQGYTDAQGSLEFTVSAQGPVRISIPFLGFNHLVTGAEANVQVRVPPHSFTGGAP